MKRVFLVLTLVMISSMLIFNGCSKEEEAIKNNDVEQIVKYDENELFFTNSSSELTNVSRALGFIKFENGKIKDNVFSFNIISDFSEINFSSVNFNNVKVNLIKKSNQHYILKYNCDLGFVELEINKLTNTVNFQINNEKIDLEEGIIDINTNIAFTSAIVLFTEITQFELERGKYDAQKSYYGYSIGWGWTSSQSQDHASELSEACLSPDGACTQYGCTPIGSADTSCIWGSIWCITVITYNCTG